MLSALMASSAHSSSSEMRLVLLLPILMLRLRPPILSADHGRQMR